MLQIHRLQPFSSAESMSPCFRESSFYHGLLFKEVASAAELASMSEEEYRKYMNFLNNYRTAVACYDYAFEEGEAKGEVKGYAKATRDHAIAFKKAGATVEMIATALNMSIEEVEDLPTD